MRRYDKITNINKVNILVEQRYLMSKGLINENLKIDHPFYDITKIKETEKAILVKIKVYKGKEGKVEFLEGWLPKSILNIQHKVGEFIEKIIAEKNKKFSEWMRSKGYGHNYNAYTAIPPKEKEKVVNIDYIIQYDSPQPKGLKSALVDSEYKIKKTSPITNDVEIFNDDNMKQKPNGSYDIESRTYSYFISRKILYLIREKYPNIFITPTEYEDVAEVTDEGYEETLLKLKNEGLDIEKTLSDYEKRNGFSFKETFMPLKDIKFKKKKSTIYR